MATAGDEVLGFVASTPIGGGLYDLGPIAVTIEKQAGGIGRALVQAAVARAAAGTTTLTVDTYNGQALAHDARAPLRVPPPLLSCAPWRVRSNA